MNSNHELGITAMDYEINVADIHRCLADDFARQRRLESREMPNNEEAEDGTKPSTLQKKIKLLKDFPTLPNLPNEIRFQIISHAVLPKPPCVKNAFCNEWGGCSNWACEFSHRYINDPPYPLQNCGPNNLNMAFVSKMFRDECYKVYFREHFFVFDRPPIEGYPIDFGPDYHALCLLDFVEAPSIMGTQRPLLFDSLRYKATQSNPCTSADTYRREMRHLALGYKIKFNITPDHLWEDPFPGVFEEDLSWDWPLLVDWDTLPHLETLYLDLRGYSECTDRFENEDTWELYLPGGMFDKDEFLSDGLERLQTAFRKRKNKLKKFVVAGLCSFAHFDDEEHKEKMMSMLEGITADGVEIEFIDRVDNVPEW